MKKLVKILGAVLALSLCTSCTINKTVEKRTITVSGTGSVKVTPDTACVDFEVNTNCFYCFNYSVHNSCIISNSLFCNPTRCIYFKINTCCVWCNFY